MHLKKRVSVWYALSREEAEHSVATLTARARSAFKGDLDLKTQMESKVALSISTKKENIFTLKMEPAENVLRQKTL